VGNLVGVGGLTNVGPESGHVLAEIVDLLVSVWSLTLTGLVVGLVSGLGFLSMVTERADETGERQFGRKVLNAQSDQQLQGSEEMTVASSIGAFKVDIKEVVASMTALDAHQRQMDAKLDQIMAAMKQREELSVKRIKRSRRSGARSATSQATACTSAAVSDSEGAVGLGSDVEPEPVMFSHATQSILPLQTKRKSSSC